MKTFTHVEWIAEAKKRFPSSDDIVFKCVRCGNLQSINSVLAHDPTLKHDDVARWIYQSCEGRHNSKHGCDWALWGLFRIHKVEVLDEGKAIPVFEFADAPLPAKAEETLVSGPKAEDTR